MSYPECLLSLLICLFAAAGCGDIVLGIWVSHVLFVIMNYVYTLNCVTEIGIVCSICELSSNFQMFEVFSLIRIKTVKYL